MRRRTKWIRERARQVREQLGDDTHWGGGLGSYSLTGGSLRASSKHWKQQQYRHRAARDQPCALPRASSWLRQVPGGLPLAASAFLHTFIMTSNWVSGATIVGVKTLLIQHFNNYFVYINNEREEVESAVCQLYVLAGTLVTQPALIHHESPYFVPPAGVIRGCAHLTACWVCL